MTGIAGRVNRKNDKPSAVLIGNLPLFISPSSRVLHEFVFGCSAACNRSLCPRIRHRASLSAQNAGSLFFRTNPEYILCVMGMSVLPNCYISQICLLCIGSTSGFRFETLSYGLHPRGLVCQSFTNAKVQSYF